MLKPLPRLMVSERDALVASFMSHLISTIQDDWQRCKSVKMAEDTIFPCYYAVFARRTPVCAVPMGSDPEFSFEVFKLLVETGLRPRYAPQGLSKGFPSLEKCSTREDFIETLRDVLETRSDSFSDVYAVITLVHARARGNGQNDEEGKRISKLPPLEQIKELSKLPAKDAIMITAFLPDTQGVLQAGHTQLALNDICGGPLLKPAPVTVLSYSPADPQFRAAGLRNRMPVPPISLFSIPLPDPEPPPCSSPTPSPVSTTEPSSSPSDVSPSSESRSPDPVSSGSPSSPSKS